jgi:oligopeptide transport system ATP-binding protein
LSTEIGFVPQQPDDFFDGDSGGGKQLSDQVKLPKTTTKDQYIEEIIHILADLGVADPEMALGQNPQHLSLGVRQQLLIARTLAMDLKLLVVDSPFSALDAMAHSQVIELVKQKYAEEGLGVLWATNHMGFLARVARRVLVMHCSDLVEDAPVQTFFSNPQHPYTLSLLRSLPRVQAREHQSLTSISGIPMVINQKPTYCPFALRCKYQVDKCKHEHPPMVQLSSDHWVSCWVDMQTGRVRS